MHNCWDAAKQRNLPSCRSCFVLDYLPTDDFRTPWTAVVNATVFILLGETGIVDAQNSFRIPQEMCRPGLLQHQCNELCNGPCHSKDNYKWHGTRLTVHKNSWKHCRKCVEWRQRRKQLQPLVFLVIEPFRSLLTLEATYLCEKSLFTSSIARLVWCAKDKILNVVIVLCIQSQFLPVEWRQ